MIKVSRPIFRRKFGLRRLSAINAFCLVALTAIETLTPENIWPFALMLFAPQHLFAIPSVVLFFLACRKKRIRLIFANCLSLVLCAFALLNFNFHFVPSPQKTNGSNVRVMSYNIRYGTFGIAAVSAVIAAENPDVVCLQEVIAKGKFPDPLPQLKKRFLNFHVARYGQLVTLSRFPISLSRAHRLPNHNGCGILETQIMAPRKTLAIFNAHFINPIDSGVLQWPRQIQTRAGIRRAQLALLTRHVKSSATPYIIAGDFNTPPRGQLNRALSALGNDAFATSAVGFGNTFPAFLPVMRIDRIFAGRGAEPLRCRVLPARASDHRALIGDFTIR